jgi:hypothetical protein
MNTSDIVTLNEVDLSSLKSKVSSALKIAPNIPKMNLPNVKTSGKVPTTAQGKIVTSNARISGNSIRFDINLVDDAGKAISTRRFNGPLKNVLTEVTEFAIASGDTALATKITRASGGLATRLMTKLTNNPVVASLIKIGVFKIGAGLLFITNSAEYYKEYAAVHTVFKETYDGDWNEFKLAFKEIILAKQLNQLSQFAVEVIGLWVAIARTGRIINLIRMLRVLSIGGGPFAWLITLLVTVAIEGSVYLLTKLIEWYGEDLILWLITDSARDVLNIGEGKTDTSDIKPISNSKINKALNQDLRSGNIDREAKEKILKQFSDETDAINDRFKGDW